ncbi:hypothetical protein [Butyrivibrio sp. AE2032]|uniref:hypothetical protein n=1 Tax=Butyrivibrio sp. AE2032 TaxID=1458463 RepID=UPI000553ABF3|nr:hypothetical protein [Butyrivibrio sp. AE2032]
MGDIKTANILKCLKEVYDRYSEVESLVFTTFDFDPDFFANHIVSYLMGNEHEGITKIGELNAANTWIEKNHVSVYYDISGLKANDNTILTIPVYPVKVVTGVFHPKVIAICGRCRKNSKRMAHMFVSSANLTVNGYGRNVESFTAIEVTTKLVAESLSSFLKALRNTNNHHEANQFKEFISFLDNGQFIDSDKVEFFWNLTGRTSKKFWLETRLSSIPGYCCEVISPYFDENTLPERIDNIKTYQTNLYLSKDNGSYNIKKSIYQKLRQNDRVRFYQLITDEKSSERFVHAKLIKKGNSIIIGSYNFTEAALRGKNAEAAIIFNRVNSCFFHCDFCIDESAFIDDSDSINNQDTAVSSSGVFVTVTADWSTKKLTVNLISDDISSKNYVIAIGRKTIDISSSIIERDIYEANMENELLINKQFVLYESGKQIYIGRINEFGWVQCRPELSCKDLYEALSEWYLANGKSKDDLPIQYEVRSISDENDVYAAASIRMDSDKDIFDNYYYMSTAMRGMLSALENANDNQEKYRVFWTSPGSMKRLLNFIENEMNDETAEEIDYANLWMILLYLDAAYIKLPDEMKSFPNYLDEKTQFRVQLDNCITRCKNALYQLSQKKRKIGKFLKWIESEFGVEQLCLKK